MSGIVVLFTGLPCSGKTTLAKKLCRGALMVKGFHPILLDGDEVRSVIGATGFSVEARRNHLRYMAYTCKCLSEKGINVAACFVSPLRDARQFFKDICPNFLEVFVDTASSVCEARDVKGMWAKARAGEIKNFTGIDAVYERPTNPDLILDTTVGMSSCLSDLRKLIQKRSTK